MTNPDHLIDILIPTFNTPHMLLPCIKSILEHKITNGLAKIIIVNNGHPESIKEIVDSKNPFITILQMKENKGWEGGLKAGLEISKAPFVVFMNDDTFVPISSRDWLNRMLQHFLDRDCGAVGPSSNMVMGSQNIWADYAVTIQKVPFLIGFCVMFRREYLDQAGGVDDSCPHHGDDIDLSIRLRKIGKYLLCDKNVFVFHHGAVTGKRDQGDYWYSVQMIEKTNEYLIRKHGLKEFWKTYTRPDLVYQQTTKIFRPGDSEGELIRRLIKGDKVLELGCGGQKTIANSVGVDIVPKGNAIPNLPGKYSVADMAQDVEEKLPFEKESFDCLIARHLFEHMLDPVKAIQNWAFVVRPGGYIILALPDHDKNNTIPMDFTHVHAYTQVTIKTLMESLGWHTEHIEDANNGVSFVGVFQKNGVKNEL